MTHPFSEWGQPELPTGDARPDPPGIRLSGGGHVGPYGYWRTRDGTCVLIASMNEDHLLNAMRTLCKSLARSLAFLWVSRNFPNVSNFFEQILQNIATDPGVCHAKVIEQYKREIEDEDSRIDQGFRLRIWQGGGTPASIKFIELHEEWVQKRTLGRLASRAYFRALLGCYRREFVRADFQNPTGQ